MEIRELASSLSLIATIKQSLPFSMRGWVSVLGLHVQERRAGGISRLQAGGKFRSYFDAWKEGEEYRVRKFDPATWEERFADLVEPTMDVASFLAQLASKSDELSGEALVHLNQAAQIFERTGNWIGLPGTMVQNNSIDERVDAIMQNLGHMPVMAVQELEKIPEVVALVHHGEVSRLGDGTLWVVSTLYREAAKEAARDFRLLSRDGAEIMLEAVRYFRDSGKVESQPTEVTPFEEVEQSFAFLLPPGSPLYDAVNCCARATVYQDIADNCLMFAYGVFPHHRAAARDDDWISKANSVHHGDMSLGLSPRQVDASDMEYLEEVIWLYEQAREFYQEAIKLDPAHTESYLRLSQIVHQLGEQAESVRLLSKALESSNKAIQTNGGDQIRYNERAKIHESRGQFDEAISDIVQALQIAKYDFETERLNKELERLSAKSKPKDQDS